MHTYSWLVRREFWENRAIWIVPAVIGGMLTLATLFGKVAINGVVLTEQAGPTVSTMTLFGLGIVFFLIMSLYSTWYLLDCLHSDRKDRSVLFWKSLPISDTATVLAKLFTGLVAIPLVYFAAADLTTLLIAFVVSVRAHATIGGSLWNPGLWLQLQALWLYLIVTTAIWYLPFAGWLMLVSAWAKRAVILWSILPPLALYLLERWFVGTHAWGDLLLDRASGYVDHAFRDLAGHGVWVTTVIGDDTITLPGTIWGVFDTVGFLVSPATWVGLAGGAVFIVGAIQVRQRLADS